MRRERSGVTLLELLVGLTVAGIVLASVARTLVAIDASARATLQMAQRHDRVANGVRTLEELIGQVEPTSDSRRQFAGSETQAAFQTWCRAPGGWSERCMVALHVSGDTAGPVLMAQPDGKPMLPVLAATRSIRLRYLEGVSGTESRWLRAWGAGILTPFAVGVLVDDDTLVIRIGDRG